MARLPVLLAVAVLASACTASSTPQRGATSSAVPSVALPAGPTCVTPRSQPDPHRPHMTLSFAVSSDHARVTGRETVVFTPDLPVDELVFRLAANGTETDAGGNGITVGAVTADHDAGTPRYERAGAASSTQGGLLRIPFARTVPAGTSITARLAFTVTLGKPYFDRFGRAGRFAWFGSAQPLLAWQRGVGWHTEALSALSSETTTSEAMDVDLTVRAPAADTVIMTGDPTDPSPSGTTRSWHSRVAAARDVSVAVGPFGVTDAKVGDVRLRVASPTATGRAALVDETSRAIVVLSRLLGPYPFPSLSLARIPARGGGIEYPSSILAFGSDRYIVVHEVAHQWFYAMVGNSQARFPWLDEAFAQYAEETVDAAPDRSVDLRRRGRVDASTESFGGRVNTYFDTVYLKGSEALRTARDTVGARTWDAAIRCYVATNAWRIAEPTDVARALARLPAALRVLRAAGALR